MEPSYVIVPDRTRLESEIRRFGERSLVILDEYALILCGIYLQDGLRDVVIVLDEGFQTRGVVLDCTLQDRDEFRHEVRP